MGCSPWGKGGHMIRVSCGDGSDCVAEEQNDLQEGFFFNRQGTFLVARTLRLEKSGGRTQSTFEGGKGLMFLS